MTRSPPRLIAPLLFALALTMAPAATHAAPDGDAPAQAEAAAATEHAALQKEYNAARSAYYRAQREYRETPAEERGDAPVRAETTFVPKFLAAAERYAGTEDAVPFLMSAIGMARSSDPETAKAALTTLVGQHADSPQLTTMTFTLIYGHHSMGEIAEEAMKTIVSRSPHDPVKAAMLYAQGALVNRNRESTPAARQQAVKLLERAVRLDGESRYGELARGTIFELEKLQIGMPAPDIEGDDLDGVAFKLSDYRGKVVVLDFWGDW